MVEALAGNEGAQFFGISAELGPAFWILLAYSVVANGANYLYTHAVVLQELKTDDERDDARVTDSKKEEPTDRHTELYEDIVVTIETGIASEE